MMNRLKELILEIETMSKRITKLREFIDLPGLSFLYHINMCSNLIGEKFFGSLFES